MMARVVHVCNRQEIIGEAENPHILLTSPCGDYVALGGPNHSNYNGFFVREGDAYVKILSNISPLEPIEEVVISDGYVVRNTQGSSQRIAVFEQGLRASCSGKFMFTIDCKRLYDESDEGRIYSVEYHAPGRSSGKDSFGDVGTVFVTYTKYSDTTLSSKLYELHAAIVTTMHVELVQSWREEHYSYDMRRGTACTPWVYDLMLLSGLGTVAVATGGTPEQAQRKAFGLLLKTGPAPEVPSLPVMQQLAWRALAALRTRDGIMAGLPWFFQHWSRDELISCGGMIAARQYATVIPILNKWYDAVRPDGTLPAIYPDQGLASSDAPGWLGKRTRDLLVRLSEESILHQVPRDMLEQWRERTGMLLDAHVLHDGLIRSERNTTWMDTACDDDGRAGYRIEIQALYLALFDCHAYLCTLTKTAVLARRSAAAQQVIDAVHTRLVSGRQLLDGLHMDGTPDTAVRPNFFIAWYVAPKLFSDDEWRRFIADALPKLWLGWGGLSSIATDHPLFRPLYTGEAIASYHRGDSWYFVNNIAAIAMQSLGMEQERVRAIIEASTRDLLWSGYCGHASEISSAQRQEACGTHSQAWSASTLLELLQTADKKIFNA